jgi:hypothetical protein
LVALNFMTSIPLSQRARAGGLLLAGALVAGCGGGGRIAPTEPEAAVRAFLSAAKANSITAMGEYWGTSRGPAIRNMNRTEMDQRLTVMRTYLNHDRFEFTERNVPDPTSGSRRILDVQLFRGECRPVVPFTVVRWGNGWLVQSVDLSAAGNPARPCTPPAPAPQD